MRGEFTCRLSTGGKSHVAKLPGCGTQPAMVASLTLRILNMADGYSTKACPHQPMHMQAQGLLKHLLPLHRELHEALALVTDYTDGYLLRAVQPSHTICWTAVPQSEELINDEPVEGSNAQCCGCRDRAEKRERKASTRGHLLDG